jgi:hypothetical protein
MKSFLSAVFILSLTLSFAQSKPLPKTGKTKPGSPVAPSMPLPPLAGKYGGKQADGRTDSLVLRADSTYRFAEYQPAMSTPESFSGKWKVKKNDIFLYAGNDPDPYGQVRAILTADGKLEKFKVVRYFGELQKTGMQIELK